MSSTSHTPQLYQTFGWIRQSGIFLLSFLLISVAYAQKTPPDPGVPTTQNIAVDFEVDGDFAAGSNPSWWSSYGYNGSTPATTLTIGQDWRSVLSPLSPGSYNDGTTVWYVDGNSGNKATAANVEKDIFQAMSNKNGDPIGINQKPYSIVVKAGGPQKNDITNVYFHKAVYGTTTPQTWLFFGAETRSTDGTSYLDFEYNQAGVVIDGSKLYGPKDPNASNVINGRTVGDFIVVVNFSGGGKKPSVAYRTWLSSGVWSAETTANLGSTAFAVINIQDVPAIATGKAFTGDGSPSNTTAAFQLVEGGLNITPILPSSATCAPFATMTVKSRSSDSFTAELKDLALLNYPLNPAPTLEITDLSGCPGTTVDLNAGVTSDGTVSFYTDEDLTDLMSADDVAAAPVGATYYVKAVSTAGCETSGPINVTEDARPAGPVVQITEPTLCGSATATLTVPSSIDGATYTLYNRAGDLIEEKPGTGNDLVFEGLIAGSGFSITVTVNGCISDPATCPTDLKAVKQSSQVVTKTAPAEKRIRTEAYPNPTGRDATINFSVPRNGHVKVELYNAMGSRVATLYDGEAKGGENKSVLLKGSQLPTGTYYYKVTADGKTKTNRISLVK